MQIVSYNSMGETVVLFGDLRITFLHVSPYQINKINNWLKSGKIERARLFFMSYIDQKRYLCQS